MLSIDAWLDEKPYKEIYDGRIHPKVSPKFDHGLVAAQISHVLTEWAGSRGGVAVELRVYLGEGTTLVPDVSFVSRSRLSGLSPEQRQTLPFAPDITVEVRSPGDSKAKIRRKTALYLAHGAMLVLNVDPAKRTVTVSTAEDERVLHDADAVQDPRFDGLVIPVAGLFGVLDAL